VEELGTCESILSLHLRGKVTKDDHGWLVRSDEDGSHKKLEVGKPLRVANKSQGWWGHRKENALWIGCVEL
jgi:hypothetical protein